MCHIWVFIAGWGLGTRKIDQAVKLILPAWLDNLEESFSYKVHLKKLPLPVKTSCPHAEKVNDPLPPPGHFFPIKNTGNSTNLKLHSCEIPPNRVLYFRLPSIALRNSSASFSSAASSSLFFAVFLSLFLSWAAVAFGLGFSFVASFFAFACFSAGYESNSYWLETNTTFSCQ